MSLQGMLVNRVGLLVSIEQSTETQTVGEPVLTWSTVSPWWAAKVPRGGSEGQAGGQIAYATRANTWCGKWIPGVHEGMRLNESGVVHDIDVVDESGQRRGILVLHTTQRNTV